MAETRPVQLKDRVIGCGLVTFIVVVPFAVCFSPALILFEPRDNNNSREEIRVSAIPVVLFWCCGWPVVFAKPGTGLSGNRPSRYRFFWTVGCLQLLLHIAIAFHVGHGWSHRAAWEHTQQISGYGDGIFVNYLFALVWLADVVWAWAAFESYLSRPRWVNWTIHGFFTFIMFNAAVVFGGTLSRVVFTAFFGLALATVWEKRVARRHF